MNLDSNAILALCSYVCVGDGVQPLEPKEYSELAKRLVNSGKSPKDLFEFTTQDFEQILDMPIAEIERVKRLLDRNASLSFELGQYCNMGINTVTRADEKYPHRLKKKLGNACPPIFYYAGDLTLLEKNYIGYVGSRTVGTEDVEFTKNAVRKTTALRYGVVSGGAKGIDTVSGTEALLNGSFAVEFLSDSLMKKLKRSDTIRNVQDGNLLLMSVSKPDAGFNVGFAMMRNRYIYSQSEATVIVRSDLNKGGTWTGATDNLKNNWCPTLCWEHNYSGNKALIEKGAIPIPTDWNGIMPEKQHTVEKYEQTSIFDM